MTFSSLKVKIILGLMVLVLAVGGYFAYSKIKTPAPEKKAATTVNPGDPSLAKSCGSSYRSYLNIDKSTASDDQLELGKKAQACFSNVVSKATVSSCEVLPALFTVSPGSTLSIENTGLGAAELSIRPNDSSTTANPQDTQSFTVTTGQIKDVKLVSNPTAGSTLAFHVFCKLPNNHNVDAALFLLGK